MTSWTPWNPWICMEFVDLHGIHGFAWNLWICMESMDLHEKIEKLSKKYAFDGMLDGFNGGIVFLMVC